MYNNGRLSEKGSSGVADREIADDHSVYARVNAWGYKLGTKRPPK